MCSDEKSKRERFISIVGEVMEEMKEFKDELIDFLKERVSKQTRFKVEYKWNPRKLKYEFKFEMKYNKSS